jgi:hypothetical protein
MEPTARVLQRSGSQTLLYQNVAAKNNPAICLNPQELAWQKRMNRSGRHAFSAFGAAWSAIESIGRVEGRAASAHQLTK